MKPVALITGASAGIGVELARVFAAHGHELVLVARREDRLERAGRRDRRRGRPRPTVLALDLERRDAVAALAAAIDGARASSPHYVVNNAGFGLSGPAAELSRDEQLAHDRSQCARAHRTVAGFCRQPRAPSRRHSQCGVGRRLHARPRHGGLLRQQGLCAVVQRGACITNLAGRGIRVTALCPGPVPTEFQARSGMQLPSAAKHDRAAAASRVAQIGYDGLMRGRASSSPASATRSRLSLMRFVPNALLMRGRRSAHAALPAANDARLWRAVCFALDERGRHLQKRDRIAGVMQQPILIVLHQEHSTPGRVGNALRDLGYPLDVRRPRFGDPLPATMAEHAGAIIFGGPMSANDPGRFHPPRDRLDRRAAARRTSRFSASASARRCCARQLGGKVFRHPRGSRRDRLLPDPADRRRPRRRRCLAGMRLSMAPRRFRPAARRRASRRGRYVRSAGDPRRPRLRAAIPSRRDPRHDAQMDDARPRPHGTAGRQAARTRISPTARSTIIRRAPGSAYFWSAGSRRRERALRPTAPSSAEELARNRRRSWYRPATRSIAAAPGNSAVPSPQGWPRCQP